MRMAHIKLTSSSLQLLLVAAHRLGLLVRLLLKLELTLCHGLLLQKVRMYTGFLGIVAVVARRN